MDKFLAWLDRRFPEPDDYHNLLADDNEESVVIGRMVANGNNYEPFDGNSPEFRMLCGRLHVLAAAKITVIIGIVGAVLQALFWFCVLIITMGRPTDDYLMFGGTLTICFFLIFFHIPTFIGIKKTRPAYLIPFICMYSCLICLSIFAILTMDFEHHYVYAIIVLAYLCTFCVMLYPIVRCKRYLTKKRRHQKEAQLIARVKQQLADRSRRNVLVERLERQLDERKNKIASVEPSSPTPAYV